MPSTINTCFGWVLFGKTKGSDAVNVANLMLEQDVLKELTGPRYSYAAGLTTDKKKDLQYVHVYSLNQVSLLCTALDFLYLLVVHTAQARMQLRDLGGGSSALKVELIILPCI